MSVKSSSVSTLQDASAGLLLLRSSTFSSASSVSLDNVFSNSYTRYRIILSISSASGVSGNVRLRSNGTSDSNSGVYLRRYVGASTNNAAIATGTNSGSTWDGLELYTDDTCNVWEILSPYQSGFKTSWQYQVAVFPGGTTNMTTYFQIGATTTTSQYDGIEIYPSSGTITGEIQIYGYNQG